MSTATAQSYLPSNINDLSGRIAVVTGGGTGIGWMISQGLAAAGAKVYITGRRLEVLQKAANGWDKTVGGEIIALQMDVVDKESISKAKALIEEKEGRIHILINNAGQVGPTSHLMNKPGSPESATAESLGDYLFNNESFGEWSDLFAINTSAIFFVTTAFLGLLAKGSQDVEGYMSSVVSISSISGIGKLSQSHFCYNASKAAASHITRMFATEMAAKNIPIRVNSIAPGVFGSEMTIEPLLPEHVDLVAKGFVPVPIKRGGTGQEIAGTAVYLVSRAGGYVTGQEIVVDGGLTAVNPARV